jgi:hypothetical protein
MHIQKPAQLERGDLDRKKPKDDWEINTTQMDEKYIDSQFWKLPDPYNIEDLLDEQAKDEQQNKQ